jgi:hypothetical protein
MYINSQLKKDEKLPKVLEIINKLPIHFILLVFATGMLAQLRLVHPYYVNRAVKKFLSVGSNGVADKIFYRAISLFMGYKID